MQASGLIYSSKEQSLSNPSGIQSRSTLSQESMLQTKGVREYAKQTFEEENGIEIKQVKRLGRPKESATYGSVGAKLGSRELVEKLLRMQAKGEEIFMFGSMVKVKRFYEKKRPTTCHQCQRYGHINRDC